MCGVIGGLFRDGHVPDRSRIDQSLELIRHRGPDDSGSTVVTALYWLHDGSQFKTLPMDINRSCPMMAMWS